MLAVGMVGVECECLGEGEGVRVCEGRGEGLQIT